MDVLDQKQKAIEIAAARQRAKTDKLFLATEILGYDFQTDVHTDLFENYLQIDPAKSLADQDTKKDRLVLWSRGFYKTTSIVVEIVQLVLSFPDIRILLMQGTVKNTRLLLKEIKSHFTGEKFNSKLNEFFPEFCGQKLGTADQFTTPARERKHLKEATVTVASPKSVKAGQHYDAGFFDDLIHEQNYRNPELVQKAIDDFNHYVPLIDPGGYRYVTGTRYTFGDLYEWIIRHNTNDNWKITWRDCWITNPDGTHTSRFLPRKLKDGRTVGISTEELEQKQHDDAEMFAAQYLNKPISTSAQLFTEELMLSRVKSPRDEDFPQLGTKILFVDLATSGNNDDSVILCAQRDTFSKMYVTDVRGGKFTTPTFALHIIEMALIHRPIKILIENSAAGVVFVEYLRVIAREKGLYLPVDFIKVKNTKDAKTVRISNLSGVLRDGRLFFLAGAPCWETIVEQFTTFPRNRHDDYPDTVALMVQFFQQNDFGPVPTVHPMFQQQASVTDSLVREQPYSEYSGGMGSYFADS